MEINLTKKRIWAKQRKIEADEIRRERNLIGGLNDYYRQRQENSAWDSSIVIGFFVGAALLVIFKAVIYPVCLLMMAAL